MQNILFYYMYSSLDLSPLDYFMSFGYWFGSLHCGNQMLIVGVLCFSTGALAVKAEYDYAKKVIESKY